MADKVNEGDAVILSGALSDPDANDRHSVKIYWLGDADYVTQPGRQKVLLEPGQTTFQVTHVYKDDLPSTPVKVMVIDRQLPDGSNDNSEGRLAFDLEIMPLEVRNVAPAQLAPHQVRTLAHREVHALDDAVLGHHQVETRSLRDHRRIVHQIERPRRAARQGAEELVATQRTAHMASTTAD
jgi:hypothetical protein